MNQTVIENIYQLLDRYFEYDRELIKKILKIRDKISNYKQLSGNLDLINDLEREITLFHARAVKETIEISKIKIDLIGFHGQTIFHDPTNKITKQLGDGKIIISITKKKVIYNFRQNDIDNGGQGAPLTPIFHNVLANKLSEKFNLKFPVNLLNIGGIANITSTVDWQNFGLKKKFMLMILVQETV